MLGKVIGISTVVSLGAVILMLQATTPNTIGPFGIFVLFVLLYVSAVGLLTFLVFIGSRATAKAATMVRVQKAPMATLSLVRSYYFASVLALAPIMTIGMQSIGEVGGYELILVAIFMAVACVYIAKRTQ